MTDTRISLSELERLHREATPGPWHSDGIFNSEDPTRTEYEAFALPPTSLRSHPPMDDYDSELIQAGHDVRLSAAARNALPASLAAIGAALRVASGSKDMLPDHPNDPGIQLLVDREEWRKLRRALEPFRE